MHTVITKHANQQLDHGSDFTQQLANGDTLVAPVSVVVARGSGTRFDPSSGRFEPVGGWTDVSSEFISGSPAPEIQSNVVAFRIKKRAAGEQLAGSYLVRVECPTANGENLVDTWELEITDEAVPQ